MVQELEMTGENLTSGVLPVAEGMTVTYFL